MHAKGPNFYFSFGFCGGERFFFWVVPNVFTLDSHRIPNRFPPRSQSVPKDILNSITLLSDILWPKLNFDIKVRTLLQKKNTHTHTQIFGSPFQLIEATICALNSLCVPSIIGSHNVFPNSFSNVSRVCGSSPQHKHSYPKP